MAAPAYRSHATASINNATLTINKPSGAASGDVLLAHIHHVTGNQSINPTPPSIEWEMIGVRLANSSSTQWWFWKAAGGSEPASYDWTGLPSGFQEGSITAISGADTTNPLHQIDQMVQTNIGGTSVALTVTTTIPDCLLWASVSIDASDPTTFIQGQMTERWDESLTTSDLCHAGYTGDALTAATYDRTIIYSPAQRCGATLLAIAPGGGAADITGTATAAFTAAAAAGGQREVVGQATAAAVFTAAALGTSESPPVLGVATAGLSFTAAAAGSRTVLGAASVVLDFSGLGFGQREVLAAASAAETFNAQMLGLRTVMGAAAATPGFTASALGIIEGSVLGAANASLAFTAVAGGQRTILGQALGTYALTAGAQGQRTVAGLAVGSYAFAADAFGLRLVSGTAQASLSLSADAAGGVVAPFIPARTATATVRSMPGAATVRASSTTATARTNGGTATVRSPA